MINLNEKQYMRLQTLFLCAFLFNFLLAGFHNRMWHEVFAAVIPEENIMKYVVMVSHGEFAPGLHSAVKMMTGDREDVLSTSLKSDMSADQFAANFEELVKDFTTEDQVILLADILSGSPFTNALNVLDQKGMLPNTLIIAGMNMPLAITAVLMKDNFDHVQDLKDTLLSEGRSGLTDFTVSQEDEDEDL